MHRNEINVRQDIRAASLALREQKEVPRLALRVLQNCRKVRLVRLARKGTRVALPRRQRLLTVSLAAKALLPRVALPRHQRLLTVSLAAKALLPRVEFPKHPRLPTELPRQRHILRVVLQRHPRLLMESPEARAIPRVAVQKHQRLLPVYLVPRDTKGIPRVAQKLLKVLRVQRVALD